MGRIIPWIAACAFTLTLSPPIALADGDGPPPRPSPEHDVARVIFFQLEALQEAGDADAPADRGMATVFAFASPANQEQTGPLERFDAMVRQPPYAVLVGHARHHIAEMMWIDAQGHLTEDPDAAILAHAIVIIDNPPAGGDEHWFMWVLSKQTDEPFVGCWMSDVVTPIDPPARQPPPDDVV